MAERAVPVGGLTNAKLALATATAGDVASGKTFYAGNREIKTGTAKKVTKLDTTNFYTTHSAPSNTSFSQSNKTWVKGTCIGGLANNNYYRPQADIISCSNGVYTIEVNSSGYAGGIVLRDEDLKAGETAQVMFETDAATNLNPHFLCYNSSGALTNAIPLYCRNITIPSGDGSDST